MKISGVKSSKGDGDGDSDGDNDGDNDDGDNDGDDGDSDDKQLDFKPVDTSQYLMILYNELVAASFVIFTGYIFTNNPNLQENKSLNWLNLRSNG